VSDPQRFQVIGGAGGVDVHYKDLALAAAVLRSTAGDLLGTADAARAVLSDPGLIASAVLDPAGFARVEAAVLAAVGGPHGLLLAAARLEERSLTLHAAVLRYEAADRLGAGLRDVRHWVEGTAAAMALPLVPLLAASPAGLAIGPWARSPGASTDIDALLAAHPGLAEEAAGASPALLSTAMALTMGPVLLLGDGAFKAGTGRHLVATSVEDASGLLGLLYPAGSAQVIARGTDTAAEAEAAPGGVGDLIAALAHRDARAHGETQGEIDVRRLRWTRPDGSTVTSWVVDVPGTKAWQFDPRRRDHLNDLATNLTTIAGEPSARVDGVMRALRLAGVQHGEPVMLVGHSQGGLVAMRAAEQCAQDGRFRVTHVVTAGSPTSRMDVPSGVQVLSLENRFDLVPRLDGEPPPPEPNRVTLMFDEQTHDVGRNHAMQSTYLPAARHVDHQRQISLTTWRDTAQDFFAPTDVPVEVRTTVWDIRNGG
jgi:pimeloyl-ACP methyl ester carboxylesterase